MKNKILPIILCGGSGTRLWPLSRSSYPKQYISLFSNNEESLLQSTVKRIAELDDIDDPIFICNEDHRFIVAEQMRMINVEPKAIILEPVSRNTAPAITIAALKSNEFLDDQILLVLSSDHIIREKDKYFKAIKNSIKLAETGKLITFGTLPTSPETGYGYIKAGESLLDNEKSCFRIKKFIEKPNISLAKKLIADDSYTWNSGIFVFKSATILEELRKYEPEILKNCTNALTKGFKDLEFQRLHKISFEKCNDISIDIAVMERTDLGVVLKLDAGWRDVGSWQSLWENEDKDKDGNVLSGKVFARKVKNSYLKSDSRLLVCNKLENLVVVETNDAILISDKDDSQSIKKIVTKLANNGFHESNQHRKVYRPWGSYLSIAEDKMWQVKRIEVNPGSKLSLQMHRYRAEHWVVVKGIANVNIEDKHFVLKENQSTFIPLGAKHRLSNKENYPLILVEVQSGAYLGEDDIIRFKDDYGRN